MRIWFDTEFVDDGRSIELLSIGLVREDGAEFYAEPIGAARECRTKWLRENVLPHLSGPAMPRRDIAERIVQFVGTEPEFWADYGAYDWVVLAQLYGPLIDRPQGWSLYYRDVRWLRDQVAAPVIQYPPFDGQQHHALADARHCKARWETLMRLLGRA